MPEQPPLLAGVEPRELIDQTHEAERRVFEDGPLANLPFSGLYWELRQQEGWYYLDAAYIAWKSLPKDSRSPRTIEELANILGVSKSTISKRRQKNPEIEARANMALMASSFLERMDDVVEALLSSAATPSYKNHPDRKLALEMGGLYTPKQSIDLTARADERDLAEMKEEELRRLAAKAPDDGEEEQAE